ncbi:MAG: chemotaxis response regulator protein-glutamate methylesterase [Acidobacteriia bacterium]|nr:chemotaxis response regulator protein-glutamate methylesterase [Terriglobia bacterium]
MGALSKKIIRRGSRIRVLVVDDSVVIRRLVTHALEADPSLEVVGSAPNGAIGLARIPQLNPDVITLDIEMPEVDGLEMLRRLRPAYPDLRVIMFSTLTERGAASTMEALSLGADDYVTKASNEGSLDRSLTTLRSELIPKIKQFFSLEQDHAAPSPVATAATVRSQPVVPNTFRPSFAPEVVAIGISTGGPTALGAIIPTIPSDFPLPILIVQHMPPVFTRLLAERLQAATKLKVEEATEGAVVEPGKVLIAPGNYHMRLSKKRLAKTVTLDQGPPENSCRPAVDVMFRSVEEVYGGSVIAAVLTGMGYDGLRGAEILKAHGAWIIAQDEASSVVWGMPGAVVNAGLADSVVPLDGVIPEILRRTGRATTSPRRTEALSTR